MISDYNHQDILMFISMFYLLYFVRMLYTDKSQTIISLIAIGSGVGYLLYRPIEYNLDTLTISLFVIFYGIIEHFKTNN